MTKLKTGVINKNNFSRNKIKKLPPWRKRMEGDLKQKRKECGQITEYLRGVRSKRLDHIVSKIKEKYKIQSNIGLEQKKVEFGLQITALAKRIKNADEKYERKKQNHKFETNQKLFYRELREEKINVERIPSKTEVEEFWKNLYENEKKHNDEAEWLGCVTEAMNDKPTMNDITITLEDFSAKLSKFSNHKSAGIDKVTNYWIKQLTELHPYYIKSLNRILNQTEEMPKWFNTGATTLIPKTVDTHLPQKYRPICCLPTIYKTLTGILADQMYNHLIDNNMLEKQQRGCIRRTLGAKDQLLINKAITENSKKRQTNLSMAWIDYKKAYDSIPHSWINKIINIYKISPNIIEFLKESMKHWSINLNLHHTSGSIDINHIKIKTGIFQGDSLSPLLFCMCVDPLSKLLNISKTGYRMKENGKNITISHLLYMDDLKLYAKSDAELEKQLQIVHNFSRDISMEFGLDKCNKVSVKKGRQVLSGECRIEEVTISELEAENLYKYLGVEENVQIEHQRMREKLKSEYSLRLGKILKTKLTTKNKIKAINQLAHPVLQYSFGIINWPQKYLNEIDVITRKLLIKHKLFYKNNCMDRLYLPRIEGGMGLQEIDQNHRAAVVSLAEYLRCSDDEYISMVKEHHENTNCNASITKMSEIFENGEIVHDSCDTPTVSAKKRREKFVKNQMKKRKEKWKSNARAGKFYEYMTSDSIDQLKSYEWLTSGIMKYDEERIILGAQDQGLITNGFKKMVGISENDKCRFCSEAVESANHLISSCKVLMAEGRYTTRHNRICRIIHWKILKEYGIDVCQRSWMHEPPGFVENDIVKITYDRVVPTGRFIESAAVRPDIVIIDNEKKTALVIDVSVPSDFGLGRAEREKIIKYQDLKNDIKDTYGLVECEVIPVIVGATGVVKKNLTSYLKAIPGRITVAEVQQEAVWETASILKRALGSKLLV